VLTNAIYFKGAWLSQFRKDGTREADFSLSADKKVKTQMMYQGGQFGYFQTREVQVLELPYKGKELSMIVVLPKKIDGLREVEKTLTAKRLSEWTESLRSRKVQVYLPKFKVTSVFQLKTELSALGLEDAFSSKADFSGMDGSRNLFLSEVIHKAFVDVNEKGTEAAGATGVVVETKSEPVRITEFRADHPFLFLIRDTRFGNTLFLGRLTDPSKG
jgi:serpin B